MSTLESRIQTLLNLGRTIYRQRPDLQAAFSGPDTIPFWVWLQTHGCLEYPEVRDASIALPPDEIQQRVNCGDSWGFLLNGASIYTMLLRVLSDHGRDLVELSPVLDFGCGPGMSLRFFLPRALDVDFAGSDIDRRSIEWCRDNFPFGKFHLNRESPPTDFRASQFGFVYAISVFSHLAEANQRDWLQELARVTRAGGILVVTVHGRHALRRASAEEKILRMLAISTGDLARAHEDVDCNGIAFVQQPSGHLNRALYGISFVTEDYVRRFWVSGFDCIGYESGALDNWQDVVVLRRSTPTMDGCRPTSSTSSR